MIISLDSWDCLIAYNHVNYYFIFIFYCNMYDVGIAIKIYYIWNLNIFLTEKWYSKYI
jgi:hypothetical protein